MASPKLSKVMLFVVLFPFVVHVSTLLLLNRKSLPRS